MGSCLPKFSVDTPDGIINDVDITISCFNRPRKHDRKTNKQTKTAVEKDVL